ncbi:MAG: TRAP transporter small permease subunit [Tabrizicola sp.]|uniref:TRAP transporter small permease n=1 Tax=Tabrizicola sp. TaxID=2005166 RepID=UPI002ABC5774|nr:TRAP transporter small permease subunit [Tabrizicola sp.]MDZ4089463.1 TRAP transporter small permease subunit [Tabrizicola sp.]
MTALLAICNGLGLINGALLALGRWFGAVCLGLMVVVILAQVFFRYVVNNALPWPEEASRFLMMWSTALMAPTAFRRGGFVAIDMVIRLLPRLVATGLSVFLMGVTILVLWIALGIGWSEVTGLGGRFETDSLRVPVSLDLATWMKVPKSWMMASLLVGVALLLLVAVELALRNLYALIWGPETLREIAGTITLGSGAE